MEAISADGKVVLWNLYYPSSFVLFPIGLFLTIKAMRDSQLFNNEAYFRFFKKLRSFIKSKREGAPAVKA